MSLMRAFQFAGVVAGLMGFASLHARAQSDGNSAQLAGLRTAVAKLAAPPVQSKPPVASDLKTPDATHLDVSFQTLSGGVTLNFPWTKPVGAAAFMRNDTLWVVFDAPITVRHAELDPKVKLRVRSASQTVHAQATVLTYRLTPGQWAGVEQSGTGWAVSIKDTEILPRTILSTQVSTHSIAGSAVAIAVNAPSAIVAVTDPQLGDTILVAPVKAMAQGFAKPALLRGGELLQTAQGVAFVPLSSRYALVRQDESLLITDSAASSSTGSASSFVRSSAGATTARLIDQDAWSLTDGRRFEEIDASLLYELSMAPAAEQQKKRWQIATFYLARGLPQRALGVLEAMARKDKQAVALPQFRAVRGVAALMARNYAAAREDLLDVSLDGVGEMWLWRAKLHDVEGRAQAAVEAFRRGSDVISYYPAGTRADFELVAIRSAILTGDGAMAQRELSLMQATGLPPAQRSETTYWRGRLAALQGHVPEALTMYRSVKLADDRRSFALAQLSATRLLADGGKLKLTPAIEALERLRYAWRGDMLELDLLDTLATYYTRSRRYREALVTYRQAANYFVPSERTREATIAQDGLFRALFLDGAADALTPVQALALFTDFRGLTPLGTDGDLMIRRLSERLVDVALYARAAELLEHQVRYRLEGTAQAVVASRLAMVQILAGKPQAALDVIRFTRTIVTSDDVLASRNRIEARALIDLGDYEAAEVMTDNDSSAINHMLRADLAWKRKDWRQLVAVTTSILGADTDGLTIAATDRRKHILRLTFALNMLNNGAGLQNAKSRYESAMAGTEYEQAFNLLASGATLGPADIRSLSKTLVSIDQLDSFRDIYRAELRSMDIPLTTTATLTPQQAAALTPAAGKLARTIF
jgi:tetratricopeptide (TPR) repeat protein